MRVKTARFILGSSYVLSFFFMLIFLGCINVSAVNITFPQNTTYSYSETWIRTLNYTISEANPDSCWYSTDGGLTNSSPVSAGTNFTWIPTPDGTVTWKVYCNDTSGNENSSSVVFISTTIHPIWDPSGEESDILDNTYYDDYNSNMSLEVSEYCNMSDSQLRDLLDTSGRNNSNNLNLVHIVYDMALLYHLTNNTNYSDKSAVLLDRYAEVFPNWTYNPYYGYWESWFHANLGVNKKLAQAYDLIYNSGSFESIGSGTKQKVRDFLILVVQRDFQDPLYIFNSEGTRPLGMVVFGRVLGDPELTHLGYWHYNKHMHEYFFYDGFSCEGTYAYSALDWYGLSDSEFDFYLNNYSDPLDYTHVPFDDHWDSERIDNYDFNSTFSDSLARMHDILYSTSFPDNITWPVLNDGSPTNYGMSSRGDPHPPSESMLMGGLGHAILASGIGVSQTQVRLDFSPGISHGHYDANHLIYYDKGTETVGGTSYIEANRTWNTCTLNQNLVLINEREQKYNYYVNFDDSPYIPGTPPAISTFTNRLISDNTNVHNNIVLFDKGYSYFNYVQVVEVDALNAYDDEADRYQRMLALVNISGEDVYLIDFFRVKGGTQYNWNMHGGHENYTLSFNMPMTSTSGSLLSDICSLNLTHYINKNNTWSAVLNYSNASKDIYHKIIMAGKENTIVYKGTGFRSVGPIDGPPDGNQDYVSAQRTSINTTEEYFLVVHETYNTTSHVQNISELQFDDNGTAIGLAITLDNNITDYVIQTLDEAPYVQHNVSNISNFSIKGRFAHVRVENGNVIWMNLVDGESLSYGQRSMSSARGDYSYNGTVTDINRKEEGDSENSFVVNVTLPGGDTLDNKTVIIKWGNNWTWSYKIKNITGNRIVTDEDPGFNLNSTGIYMKYFPVPEHFGLDFYPGPVTFDITGSAVMDANGDVTATSDSNQPTEEENENNKHGRASGGGGGEITSMTYIITAEQLRAGYTQALGRNDKIQFPFLYENYTLTLVNIVNDNVEITFNFTPKTFSLTVGENKNISFNNSTNYYLRILFNSINNSKANITIKEFYEQNKSSIAVENLNINHENEDEVQIVNEAGEKGIFIWKIAMALLIIIVILTLVMVIVKIRKDQKKSLHSFTTSALKPLLRLL